MHRDSIFYQLFQRSPALLFEILTNPPASATGYQFESIAIKETRFEIDGFFLQQGQQEGERSLVLRQLRRRLGELPEAIRSRIESLPIAQLENLAEALLDFTSLADLETWLATCLDQSRPN